MTYPLDPQTLTAIDARFIDALINEVNRARRKFPGNNIQMMALSEEHGELANALIEHSIGKAPPDSVWIEAVQVAAMALRVAIDGDASTKYRGARIHNARIDFVVAE